MKKRLTKEVHRMKASMRRAMLLLSATTMALLAITACSSGSSQEEVKARPLPEKPQELRPGEYRSEVFKPSLSFRVGKGWSTSQPETSDYLEMEWAEKGGWPSRTSKRSTSPSTNPPRRTRQNWSRLLRTWSVGSRTIHTSKPVDP